MIEINILEFFLILSAQFYFLKCLSTLFTANIIFKSLNNYCCPIYNFGTNLLKFILLPFSENSSIISSFAN